MSTLKNVDPCADYILDFVAIGESGGNYNAVIGDAKATTDLAQFPLAYIKTTLMGGLLRAGRPSTAVGRYQIIRRTLENLQQMLNMKDEELFTSFIQDQMGLRLLVGRGYLAWKAGKLTDPEFARNISCEWASLPDPSNGGKSHYDGIGPNHAGTTLEKVYAALTEAKGLIR